MNEDTWYFAYGSNMSMRRKETRTGTIRRAVRCRLPRYRLAFNKRASNGGVYTNIVPDPTREVWGVAYLCDAVAMDKLDRCEGVLIGHYRRETVEVVTEGDQRISCVTYIATAGMVCDEGVPEESYLRHLLDGARDHDLPEYYIEEIKALCKLDTRRFGSG